MKILNMVIHSNALLQFRLKMGGGGVTPFIYDIVRICLPNRSLFQGPQVYDKPPVLKRKYMNSRDFMIPIYMHIFFAQILVKALFSH